MCSYPSIRVERSLCMLCQKGTYKLNRYSDEQVHLWTCRTVETLMVDLNGYQKDCMKMNK